MTKKILKEISIIILILIALFLILAILLYGYSPTSITIPNKVAYSTPENINTEINSSADSETTTPVIITYELDETKINNSKKAGSYDSGKQNPFAKPVTDSTEEDGSTNENTKEKNNTTTSGNNSTSEQGNSAKQNTTSYLPATSGK